MGVATAVQEKLFDAVVRVGRALETASSPEAALDKAAAAVSAGLGGVAVAVAFVDDDPKSVRVYAVASPNGQLSLEPGVSLPSVWVGLGDEEAGGPIARTSVSVLAPVRRSDDPRALPKSACLFQIKTADLTGVLIVVPLDASSQLAEAELEFCSFVADQIGLSVGSKRSTIRHAQRLAQVRAQRRLVDMVLEDRGLAALATELAEQLGNPVIVTDPVFHHVAHSPHQEGTDEHRRQSLAEGGPTRRVLDDPAVRHEFQRVDRARRPVMLKTFPEHGWIQRRVQGPIFMGNELLGRITVAEVNRPITAPDYDILQEATLAFALELMKQRVILETEHRLKADFLRELLSGAASDTAAIVARAAFLGIDLLRSWDLLVVEVDEASSGVQDAYRDPDWNTAKRRIFENVRRSAVVHGSQNVAVVHGQSVVILTPNGAPRAPRSRDFAEQMRLDMAYTAPHTSLSIGVGSTCHRAEDFPASFARARRALEAARSLGRTGTVVALEDLGIYGLLFHPDDRGEMVEFARRLLEPLIAHDLEHSGNLVATLHAYLEENCNHRRTAERLYIHVNTLGARVARIAEVAQVDVHDATTRLNLHLALQIMRLSRALVAPAGSEAGEPR